MIDAVDRLIAERQAMDHGLSVGMAAALAGHLLIGLACVVLPALLPKPQLIRPQTAFAVILPRGGGGTPAAEEAAQPAPRPEQRAPEPPARASKIIKPPREEPRQGLAAPDARKARPRPETERAAPTAAGGATVLPGGARGFTIGPPGPGVPDGADTGGDWYLAGVQRRIWTIWASQVKPQTQNPVLITFTILADGSVTDVRVLQPSGVSLVDFAAQRAVLAAAPFAILPRDYGTDRLPIQAVFRPTQ
jgi:periplasmic protein TonB